MLLLPMTMLAACGGAPSPQASATPESKVAAGANPEAAPSADGSFRGCRAPKTDIDHDWTISRGCTALLEGSVRVVGGTFTVEEGARIAFARNAKLIVDTRLVMDGTAASPIVLTSAEKSPKPGDYDGIAFADPAAVVSLRHVIVEYAGHSTTGRGGGIFVGGRARHIRIANSLFRKNAQFGFVVDGDASFERFENNTFEGSDTGTLAIEAHLVGRIGRGNKFDKDLHVLGGRVSVPTFWPEGVSYYIDHQVHVSSETPSKVATLTLPEGATMRMADHGAASISGAFRVGAHSGALVARDVTFVGERAQAQGSKTERAFLSFADSSRGSVIEGCTFEKFDAPPIRLEESLTTLDGIEIKDNTFREGRGPAIRSDRLRCAPYEKMGNRAESPRLCISK